MKVYLGIKYHADNSNRNLVEGITTKLGEQGHEVYCVTQDLEKWGETSFSADDLMRKTF